MNQSDYDRRTALHIGEAEGHEGLVRFFGVLPFILGLD